MGGLGGGGSDKAATAQLAGNAFRRVARDAARPPGVPDYTDEVLRRARERERRKNAAGGTRSTFLSGALGASSPLVTVAAKMNGGI